MGKFGSFHKVLDHQLTYALFRLTDEGFGLMEIWVKGEMVKGEGSMDYSIVGWLDG
nr:hypothetical protein [uncultured Allomuricauda sp.]